MPKLTLTKWSLKIEQKGDRSVLELNITLPEEVEKAASKSKQTKAKTAKKTATK